MAGKPRTLTDHQQAALDRAVLVRTERQRKRDAVEAEVKRYRASLLETNDAEYEAAVYAAVEVGVPKNAIARAFGMRGASDIYRLYNNEVTRRNGGVPHVQSFASFPPQNRPGHVRPLGSEYVAPPTNASAFIFTGEPGEVAIAYPEFPTSFKGADDYPAVLRGIVKRDEDAPNQWTVVEDESDTLDERGQRIPGWLTAEVDKIARSGETLFTDLLNKWYEDQE